MLDLAKQNAIRHIDSAARNAGFALRHDEVHQLAETEAACLADARRVSFGKGASARLILELANSPFLSAADTSATLANLIEEFYALRDDLPADTTDAEIIEALTQAFDGEAAGNASTAGSLAFDALRAPLYDSTYTIRDDEGRMYRWDPEEWHDDTLADGWLGEKWNDTGNAGFDGYMDSSSNTGGAHE